VADELDHLAATKNAEAKEDAERDGHKANFSDAFDAPDRQGVMGSVKDRHRAGPGEGIRAPFAQETGGQAQTSVFDGKGNESVVVFGVNEDGKPAKGVADAPPSEAEAEAEAEAEEGAGHGSALGNPQKD